MHGKRVQERAAECAEELSGAELTHPFGDDWDVYKVSGKVFMLFSQVEGQPVVILKSAPGAAKALVEGMDDFTPGYHMNKEHWITLHGGGRLDGQLVDDLVTESYPLVLEKLPRRLRHHRGPGTQCGVGDEPDTAADWWSQPVRTVEPGWPSSSQGARSAPGKVSVPPRSTAPAPYAHAPLPSSCRGRGLGPAHRTGRRAGGAVAGSSRGWRSRPVVESAHGCGDAQPAVAAEGCRP